MQFDRSPAEKHPAGLLDSFFHRAKQKLTLEGVMFYGGQSFKF